MSSVFTKIILGEIPCYKIAENDDFIAFLDVRPLVKGHTLVIPKREVDLIFDLDSDDFKNLWGFAQDVAKKIGQAIVCKRVGIAVVGLEVPHAHIHLVPLNDMQDLNFGNERLQLSADEYQDIQTAIINA